MSEFKVAPSAPEPASISLSKAISEPQAVPEINSQPSVEVLGQVEMAKRQMGRELQALRNELKALKAQPAPVQQAPQKSEEQLVAELRQQFLSDPTKFGVSYDQLASTYLSQPTPEQQREQALRMEIESLRKGQEETKTSFQKQQEQAYQNSLKQFKRQAESLVSSDKDGAYELIKAEGRIDAVVGLIEDTYKSDGIVMTVEEAAREVETYLYEQALKVARYSKVQKGLSPKEEPKQADSLSQTQQKAPTTLSNVLAQASQKSPKLSEKERLERAIAAAQGIQR